MATATVLLQPGDMLGGFRVDDVIGIGGMAIVYRAEQVSLHRPVALKVLSSKLTSDTVFRERFRREGTHAAALEHPNIVPVYDSGEENGHLYIAMRMVEGTNLAELIQTRGVTADQTVEILRPIASALDTAHAAGLIHRDVKPQNILITAQGHPYLADFGVAKGSNTYGLTATGGFVGSVNYASPEQIKGLTLTPASDVYALTAVLYQCLTGHVPYPRETDAGVMHAHLNDPPPTLPAVNGADSEFHSVLARGMAKDPGSRYGHAGDLLNAAALCVSRLPSAMRTGVPAFPMDDTEALSIDETPNALAGSGEEDAVGERSDGTEIVAPEDRVAVRESHHHTTADQRREPAPIPTASGQTSRKWRWVAAGVGAAVLIAAVIGLLAGGSGGAHATTYRRGHLELTAGHQWHAGSYELSGLLVHDQLDLSTADAQLSTGTLGAPAPVAAELPAAVRSTYGAPSHSDVVALPLGPARRYVWAKPAVRTPLSLLIIATAAGELAIACSASSIAALSATLSECHSIEEKAQVTATRVEYPGPEPHLATQISAALTPRANLSSSMLTTLNATRLSARTAGLAQIAQADASSAAALSTISASPRYAQQIKALAEALRGEASLSNRVAAAARQDARPAYASLRGRYASAAARVTSTADALAALGFSLPHIVKLSLPALPPQPANHPSDVQSTPEPTITPSTPPAEEAQPAPSYTPPSTPTDRASQPQREEEFVTEAK